VEPTFSSVVEESDDVIIFVNVGISTVVVVVVATDELCWNLSRVHLSGGGTLSMFDVGAPTTLLQVVEPSPIAAKNAL